MAVERFGLCFWRILSWVMLFGALWLFQLPDVLGGFGRGSALLIFIAGFGYFLWEDVRHFRVPSKRDIDRRIEKDSGVLNRPLTGIQDRLANDGRRDARQLWRTSRVKLMALLPRLSAAKMRRDLAARDPYALRFVVLFAFALGLLSAGPEWSVRIKDGLSPFSIELERHEKADRFTVMITPPEYTALPQMILNNKTIQGEVLSVAEGSQVKVLVNGGFGSPTLLLGDGEHVFADALEVTLPEGNGELVLKQGFRTLAAWPFEVVDDVAPSLTVLKDEPEILNDGTMSFSVSVHDDYGVQYLDAGFTLSAEVPDGQLGAPVRIRRSVVSPDGEDFELSPTYDLTAHPWAGLPAKATFIALDETGQESVPQSMLLTLPERKFEHPIAKALITLRKELIWNPEDQASYNKVSYDLLVLGMAEEFIHNDVVVYLALRTAALRLRYNPPSIKTAKAVVDLMWDTALRVEDGDLSLAARRLRDAQMALEDALQDPDIGEEEIAQRMQEMRQAMAEYLTELAREMQKRMAEDGNMPSMNPNTMNSMNQDALADFLDQMEEAMRNGDVSSAQEMLSQMQRLMDMMNPSMNAQMPPDMQMMQKGVNELEELIKRQEALLVQTEKQVDLMEMLKGLGLNNPMNMAPNKNQAAPPFVNTEANQTEQEALRFILGKLMLEANEIIGEIPETMGLAEVEMRNSAEKLGLNWPLDSISHQEDAIYYLKQAQEEMAEQLQQRMVQMTGFMLSFGQREMRRDPLGRPMGGEYGPNGDPQGSRVKVPDEGERRRVQEILKILRQRASDGSRPREELEYYRRLLKRF